MGRNRKGGEGYREKAGGYRYRRQGMKGSGSISIENGQIVIARGAGAGVREWGEERGDLFIYIRQFRSKAKGPETGPRPGAEGWMAYGQLTDASVRGSKGWRVGAWLQRWKWLDWAKAGFQL